MEFEYEISADDYAAASVLHCGLNRNFNRDGVWLFAGACLLAVALIERERGLSPVLLGAIGVWWMWAGLGRKFPAMFRRYYRSYYRRLGLEGKRYRATLTEDGFQVTGENRTWNKRWAEVSPKGEDASVFMFYSQGTLFIFAKRYLADEQQRTLRTLAGLPAV